MYKIALLMDQMDNVATVTQTVDDGEAVFVGGRKIVVRRQIPEGHKIALAPLPKGASIIKYGKPIGVLSESVLPGELIHCHNVIDNTDELSLKYCTFYC